MRNTYTQNGKLFRSDDLKVCLPRFFYSPPKAPQSTVLFIVWYIRFHNEMVNVLDIFGQFCPLRWLIRVYLVWKNSFSFRINALANDFSSAEFHSSQTYEGRFQYNKDAAKIAIIGLYYGVRMIVVSWVRYVVRSYCITGCIETDVSVQLIRGQLFCDFLRGIVFEFSKCVWKVDLNEENRCRLYNYLSRKIFVNEILTKSERNGFSLKSKEIEFCQKMKLKKLIFTLNHWFRLKIDFSSENWINIYKKFHKKSNMFIKN